MKNVFLTFVMMILPFVSFGQQLEIGNNAPEIVSKTFDGKDFKLSSLKGKIVLIDFWASWCAPCVLEQPELKALYIKYEKAVTDGRFEILGFSLDKSKENWQKVIDKYSINWIQVSDLKFWKSPIAKDYFISELPFNVIIDGKGDIIAKNLHGEELEAFLNEKLQ